MALYHSIVDLAGIVVIFITRLDELALQARFEYLYACLIHHVSYALSPAVLRDMDINSQATTQFDNSHLRGPSSYDQLTR